MKRLGNKAESLVTRLKPGVNERVVLKCRKVFFELTDLSGKATPTEDYDDVLIVSNMTWVTL